MTSVTIPNSVISIGQQAFGSIQTLVALTIESGNKSVTIGELAFYGARLTNVTIPASVTSIGANAFNGITTLLSASIANTTSIQSDTFPSTIIRYTLNNTTLQSVVPTNKTTYDLSFLSITNYSLL